MSTGDATIEEKYFNKIATILRHKKKGQTIEQVLSWLTTLHGYLSSPTGGGVRHGVDLKSGIATNTDEGRLYCNLIRNRAGPDLWSGDQIANPDLDQVAAAKLAVDRKVEQGTVTNAALPIEEEADCPDLFLCERTT